jgi:hypothetical protein
VAVLADVYAPFDTGAGAGVMEATWRDMMKHMLGSASGVVRGFGNNCNTFGDSTGMQVKVDTGEGWVRGHYAKFTSIKILAVASNASGNPRVDRVVMRADFVNNTIAVDVVTGTPAGSPVAPAVTQNTSIWETSLATIAVANGAVTVSAANVTDDRSYTTVFAKYIRNSNQAPINDSTNTDVVYNTVITRCADVSMNTAGTQFTLNRAGLWQVTAQHGFTFPVTGNPYGRTCQITDASNNIISELTLAAPENAFNAYVQASCTELFALGQVLKVRAVQRSGTSLSLIADTVKVSFMWIGP